MDKDRVKKAHIYDKEGGGGKANIIQNYIDNALKQAEVAYGDFNRKYQEALAANSSQPTTGNKGSGDLDANAGKNNYGANTPKTTTYTLPTNRAVINDPTQTERLTGTGTPKIQNGTVDTVITDYQKNLDNGIGKDGSFNEPKTSDNPSDPKEKQEPDDKSQPAEPISPQAPSYSDVYSQYYDERARNTNASYDSLREQSAADLLNAQIQTELANIAAQRTLQNQMAAQGLVNSGYYGVGNAQLQAAMMNQQNRNVADYQSALRDIEVNRNNALNEIADKADERAYKKEVLDEQRAYDEAQAQKEADQKTQGLAEDAIMADLEGKTNTQIAKYLEAMGYKVDKQANGSYKLAEDQEVSKYFRGAVDYLLGANNDEESVAQSKYGISGFNTAEEATNGEWRTEAGNKVGKDFGVKDEISYICSNLANNLKKDGMVVMLFSSTDLRIRAANKDFAFAKWVDGKWIPASKDEFDSATEQAYVHKNASKKEQSYLVDNHITAKDLAYAVANGL